MSQNRFRVLSGDDVAACLGMDEAIQVMRDAFTQLSNGSAEVPLRGRLSGSDKGEALFMPVHLPESGHFGVKLVTIFPDNQALGLPLIQALVLVIDDRNGRPVALLDGAHLTALRTGAASGLATDLLARKNAATAGIFGAGEQARFQMEAVCAVRDIERAYVAAPDPQKVEVFCETMSRRLGLPVSFAETARVAGADIVCTATTAREPVFGEKHIRPGTHINAIGAYSPDTREIPAGTVQVAKVYVDHRRACLAEAGDILLAMAEGAIESNHVRGEIGELAAGSVLGRVLDSEITLFKSVGNAVQDLAAAARILRNAEKLGLGSLVRL